MSSTARDLSRTKGEKKQAFYVLQKAYKDEA